MKIVRVVLSIIVVVLGIIIITNQTSNKNNIMPYMLMSLGALNIFNGMDFYKKNNKAQAIMGFTVGLFIIIVLIIYFL